MTEYPMRPSESEGIDRIQCRDVEFRAWLLRRMGQGSRVLDRVKTAVMRHVLASQQQLDLLDAFAEAGDRFIR